MDDQPSDISNLFTSDEDFGSDVGSDAVDSAELLSEEEDMFVDNSLHDDDLEPTEFSESLHVSDLEPDALPSTIEPMPEPVLPPVAEDMDGNGGLAGAAVKVGVLGEL